MGANPEPTDAAGTAEAAQRLLTMPSLEDSEAQLQQVIEQIGAAATELVPGLEWQWDGDKSSIDCQAPYDQTNGRMLHLRFYVSRGNTPIPDNIWPQFIERARTIAATVGAAAPETMQDKSDGPQPSRHDVWFNNPEDGTTIKVSTSIASVIAGKVGCRLPRDQFNTPIPPTT